MPVIGYFSECFRRRRIKSCFFLFFILLTQPSCLLTKQEPQQNHTLSACAESQPIAVVIERDPWFIAPGFETPRAVLYDNGTLIYLKMSDKKNFYVRAVPDSESLRKLREAVRLTDAFAGLKRFYKLFPVTDLVTADIYLSDRNRSKAVSVYGMMCEGKKYPDMSCVMPPYEMQRPDRLPEEFGRIYDIMTKISYPDEEVWIPDYIEILIWPFDHARKESLAWPADWPSISDPHTRKWGDDYSLYVSGEKLEALEAFLSKLEPGQAVLIDGKKWSVIYRFVFPGEALWTNAFSQAEEKKTPGK